MSFAHYCEEPSQSFPWLKHLFLTHVQVKCLPPITWGSLSSLGCLWQPPRLTCSSVSVCVKKKSCVSGGRFLVALAWHVHHSGFDVYREEERRKGSETEK